MTDIMGGLALSASNRVVAFLCRWNDEFVLFDGMFEARTQCNGFRY